MLQADKKRVIFAGDYAEGLLSNRLTSKRIKGYVALGGMVDLDGHILKCSREKVPEQRALNAKTPRYLSSTWRKASDIRGSQSRRWPVEIITHAIQKTIPEDRHKCRRV